MPTCSILKSKWKLSVIAAILGAALSHGIASASSVAPPARPPGSELVKVQPGVGEEALAKQEKISHMTKRVPGRAHNKNMRRSVVSSSGTPTK